MIAVLCGPQWRKGRADVLGLTREFVLGLLFCGRGDKGVPEIETWPRR